MKNFRGICGDFQLDLQNEQILPEGVKVEYENVLIYLDFKMENPIGKTDKLKVTKGGIIVEGRINNKLFDKFSIADMSNFAPVIGGKTLKRDPNCPSIITECSITHIAIVLKHNSVNPHCCFLSVWNEDGYEQRMPPP